MTLSSDGKAFAQLLRCDVCGLVQASPLPSEEELQGYYRAYSYLEPSSWVAPPAVLRSLSRLMDSFEPFRQTNQLLDVGCGAGHLLRVAQHHGWQAFGSELSEAAIERLCQEGLVVYRGHPSGFPLSSQFDIVTMSEVIEHLRDPLSYAQAACQLLRAGGILYLTTPNFDSFASRILRERWRIIQVPEHLFYFSPGSIYHLLKTAGFRSVSLRTEGVNPVEIVRCRLEGKRPETVAAARLATAMLRDAAHGNSLLDAAKKIINLGLTRTLSGDTLKVVAIK